MSEHKENAECRCDTCAAIWLSALDLSVMQIRAFNDFSPAMKTTFLLAFTTFVIARFSVMRPSDRVAIARNARRLAKYILAHSTTDDTEATQPIPKTPS